MSKKKIKVADLRESYKKKGLYEKSIEKNPFGLFDQWFNFAIKESVLEPNAMTLATADENGFPSARIVLLKDYNEKGFVFFTNYNSKKGTHLSKNPNAALVFWWGKLARQIRVEGKVEKISEEESKEYFHSRPIGSQIGAIISNQSKVIPNYNFLEEKFEEAKVQLKDTNIEKPEYWGGYRIVPRMLEFWQGSENRLHHRLRFSKTNDNDWRIERLAP